MRQAFRTRPWVFPPEPQAIREIFERAGEARRFAKGAFMPHGGERPDAVVGLLTAGLATVSATDPRGAAHVFGLLAPGRSMGDLSALNPHRVNVVMTFLRPSTVLVLPRETFLQALRSDVRLMEIYADLAILKEESALEGMLVRFTLELEERLRVLLLTVITSSGELRPDDWNLCPLGLTVTEAAQFLSADRSWVSNKLNAWVKAGDARKDGRRLYVHGRVFESVRDWGNGAPAGLTAEPTPSEHYASLARTQM